MEKVPQDLHQSSVAFGHPSPKSVAAQAASLSGFVSAALYLEALAGGTEYKLFSVHVQDPIPSPPSFKRVLTRWVSTTVIFLLAGD